jgi:CheY-like chemotaxis protein
MVELGGVIDTAVEMIRPVLDHAGHSLHVDQPDRPIMVVVDPVRLAQVLANLLHNAVRFTPHNGTIRLEVQIADEELVIRVSDSGIGIRPEMLGRIFELFQQADRPADQAPGGLGLGLTLVRRLAELHGGSVTASSPGRGKGSTFEVRLPLCQTQKAEVGMENEEKEAAETGSSSIAVRGSDFCLVNSTKRILVVDDNDDAGQSLALLLSSKGHEVRVVGDGPTALLEIGQWQPDVVFLDIGLPGMDGFEVAQRLRLEHAPGQLRLVALTGFGQDEDRQRGQEAGFDAFLIKPAEPEELMRAVHPTAS